MKQIFAILGCVIALAGTSSAQAETSGNEVFLLAAEAVLATGEGYKVEACSDTEGDDELLACVSDNANISVENYRKIKNGQALTGLVAVSFYDNSGDCTLVVMVDADKKAVRGLRPWVCQ